MTIYETLRLVALDLVQDYGTALQLQKVLEGEYNTTTGSADEAGLLVYDFFGVLETHPPASSKKISTVFSLEVGDVVITVIEGTLSVPIEVRDLILLNGGPWRIIAVDPPYDDSTVVVRTVQIRKGTS